MENAAMSLAKSFTARPRSFDVIVDALAARGPVKKLREHDVMALCPVHDDRTPSLHVTYKPHEEKTLVHCQACKSTISAADVMDALGLTVDAMFDKPLERTDRSEWKAQRSAKTRAKKTPRAKLPERLVSKVQDEPEVPKSAWRRGHSLRIHRRRWNRRAAGHPARGRRRRRTTQAFRTVVRVTCNRAACAHQAQGLHPCALQPASGEECNRGGATRVDCGGREVMLTRPRQRALWRQQTRRVPAPGQCSSPTPALGQTSKLWSTATLPARNRSCPSTNSSRQLSRPPESRCCCRQLTNRKRI